jgi:hypothetical protein
VLIYLNLILPGGFDIQLSKLYPKLKFVVQDRGPVLKQAENSVWPKENPGALAAGRVKFMEHDFFQKNPVQAAEVYWMRYIMCVSNCIYYFIAPGSPFPLIVGSGGLYWRN